MKSLCRALFLSIFVAFFISPALAKDAPDSGIKGLWIKATGLPKGATLEDVTDDENDPPRFIYSFGQGADGPAVTIAVTRYPQNALAKRIAKLDKKALAESVGSAVFFQTAKNLKFADAPAFSQKFKYPCQMASYTDADVGFDETTLFIQTDTFMFSVEVIRDAKGKYSEADAEKWLMNLEMVKQ